MRLARLSALSCRELCNPCTASPPLLPLSLLCRSPWSLQPHPSRRKARPTRSPIAASSRFARNTGWSSVCIILPPMQALRSCAKAATPSTQPWRPDSRWRSCIRPRVTSAAAGSSLLRTHDGKSTFIDYREKAPLAATETMYQDAMGNVIPDASVIGYRSIATPGSVAGLVYAERKYGRLSLKRVIAPAIDLARDGFALTAEEAHELTDPDLARFAESSLLFQRDGNFTARARPFSSRNWRGRWSASRPNPTIFTTARWRTNSWMTSRRAERSSRSTTWLNIRWWSASL